MINNFKKYYDAVNEIYSCLTRDLIGPIEEKEVLVNIEPLSTYACAILWPQKIERATKDDEDELAEQQTLAAIDDAEEVEDAVSAVNDSISSANVHKPTSMGISVNVPASTAQLKVAFSGAKYTHEEERVVEQKASQNDDGTKTDEMQTRERIIHRYTRVPFSKETKAKIHDKLGTRRIILYKELGVEITLTLRCVTGDGSRLITITAQNITSAKQKGVDQNISSMFQCKMSLSVDESVLPIYQNNVIASDIEEGISQLQYRDVRNYAYGHGCSVKYEELFGKVQVIKSEFLPSERVYQMMPGVIKNKDILNLAYWKTAPRTPACDAIMQFVDEYAGWRDGQVALAETIKDTQHHEASKCVIDRINVCIARLHNGIEILRNNDLTWKAFVLMNEAMLLQRIKTKHSDKKEINWYPFQLAYILQIIPDIIGQNDNYRDKVDLLWFPTGGGKTEAYLGVAAFTIFYRRLCNKPISDGVTVIMRYTLRLLTIQQFERATALICACEHIRKVKNIPGGEIGIGLWIGSSMTPNKVSQAKEVLSKLKANPLEKIYEGNPVQVTKCPWCGQKLDINSYEVLGNTMLIRCADNSSCEFHKGLPIYVVDEDIYRVRPTLLLSTIDKFARIAWEENTRNIFGNDCPPPELIIQDELHLISGPLGSLSGIYEIAIEYLCKQTSRNPKIIASTATVKNAKAQILNLYNRQTVQFPPAGINFDNSFFAIRADADKRPARTYFGLCEMGGSVADLLIRVYATLFFTKALFVRQGKEVDVIDQYFTTVGYFNALKDLGASSTIIQDRIFIHIRNLIARTFKKEAEKYGITPSDVRAFEHSELTSRKSSKDIKDTLDRLSNKFNEFGCYSYVLASNMLSVGIDIDRLGVMTVYNQPKSNAEYIQATSRVGRQNPGIVIAMYNNMRSRDKSHYEQFGFYHKSFYRYVEATSVTPFSLRAIEKAVHCIFVALIRLTIPNLSSNDSARRFIADEPKVIEIRDYLVNRVYEILPKHADFAAEIIGDFARDWEEIAQQNSNTLFYKSYNGYPSLLSSAEEDAEFEIPKILNSLRNVEPTVNVFFRR